jgi:HEAT repeat protein
MRRTFAAAGLLCVCAFALHAQDSKSLLDGFRRNFTIASLDVKIQILQDAAASKGSADMGPLYQQAVDFALDNTSLIPTDPRFGQLAVVAADQIKTIIYTPAKYSLLNMFKTDSDTSVRVHIAAALGAVGTADAEIIDGLNRFLDAENSSVSAGKSPDLQVIAAVIGALGKLADASSFAPLFAAMNTGYSAQVTSAARDALLALKGDLKEMIVGIIKSGSIPQKKLGLDMALATDKLSGDLKAQVAMYALDVALHTSGSDNAGKDALRAMRVAAAATLTDRKWAAAAPLLIEHLDMTIMEMDRGIVDKSALLSAISALGAIGSHDAAVRLTQYLVLLNSYEEKGKGYDEQIVLNVLDNLGKLGDKVSFDDLMYTQYLNYSAAVKKAARAALDNLKW